MAPAKSKPKPKATGRKVQKQQQEKTTAQSQIPLAIQQRLLNIFKQAFSERFSTDIQPLLQEIKGHLYNRDFLTAFGQAEYLEAYAVRWSSSRALGYLSVLADLQDYILPCLNRASSESESPAKMICLGGGAGAELVAIGGLHHFWSANNEETSVPRFETRAIDIADWSSVVENLRVAVTSSPILSAYASATTKATNAALVIPENLDITFHQRDILNTAWPDLRPLVQDASLVTILFTLNELYTTSLSLTQKFLLSLTASLREGALLLVIDSPGSYSSINLNGTEKKYPMQWLLDHTLLQSGGNDDTQTWTKIAEDDAKWFRLADELEYPIELENMRFQMHLYKRNGGT